MTNDNAYDTSTISTLSRQRACGCRVGLLSDVETLPPSKSQHIGSLLNPWIVIPCAKHSGAEPQTDRRVRAMRARDELVEALGELRLRDLIPELLEKRPVAARHTERIFALLDVLSDFEDDANTLGWDPLPEPAEPETPLWQELGRERDPECKP